MVFALHGCKMDHQDAINKGMSYRQENQVDVWEVPYLPIDPADVGRTYESIIRINSQSGKGGVAYVMDKEFGLQVPRSMHPELGLMVQSLADASAREIMPEEIYSAFQKEYLDRKEPLEFISFVGYPDAEDSDAVRCKVEFRYHGQKKELEGVGNGPIDACRRALMTHGLFPFTLESYHEHSLEHGSDSRAIAYIQIKSEEGKYCFGAGIDASIIRASIRALFSALNRALAQK